MWQAIVQQLSAALTFQFDLVEKSRLEAGDIHDCYMISNGNERYFVKVNHRDNLPLYEAEANSLRLLSESQSVLVPQPIVVGVTKNHSFIILDYLPIKPLDDLNNQYRFGQQMANFISGENKKSTALMKIIISVKSFSPTPGIKNGIFSLQSSVSAGNYNYSKKKGYF